MTNISQVAQRPDPYQISSSFEPFAKTKGNLIDKSRKAPKGTGLTPQQILENLKRMRNFARFPGGSGVMYRPGAPVTDAVVPSNALNPLRNRAVGGSVVGVVVVGTAALIGWAAERKQKIEVFGTPDVEFMTIDHDLIWMEEGNRAVGMKKGDLVAIYKDNENIIRYVQIQSENESIKPWWNRSRFSVRSPVEMILKK